MHRDVAQHLGREIATVIFLAIMILWPSLSAAREPPAILAGHGTLSGSILPLSVGGKKGLIN